jgi:hypothetical protein
MSAMLKCGMSEVDVTPPLGLAMPGYFQERRATGVKDALYAKALVVDDGERAAAIVVIDAIGIEKEEVRRIRERVAERSGIPGERVMVSATHTHTGGPVYAEPMFRDEAYLEQLAMKAADAVQLAADHRRPARFGWGIGEVHGISFNRRYVMKDGRVVTNPGVLNPDIAEPAGPIDPAVIVLRIDDPDGRPIGVVANFAVHADTVGGTRFSADYPGALSRTLKRVLGDEAVCLFTVGACGDINHIDVTRRTQRSAEQIGTILAGEVLKVRELIETVDALRVDGRLASVTAEVRRPSAEDVARALDVLAAAARIEAAAAAGRDGSAAEAPPKAADLFFARQTVLLHERNEREAELEVQVIAIGPAAIVGLPCELFTEYGLEIKRASPFPCTMISTFAGGVNGYVPTQRAFAQGGYETRLTSRTRLTPAAGRGMVTAALELLHAAAASSKREGMKHPAGADGQEGDQP